MKKHLSVVPSIFVLAITGAPAFADWGCGAQGIGAGGVTAQGRTWEHASRQSAAKGALYECRKAGGGNCSIVSCQTNIHHETHALAQWPKIGRDVAWCKGHHCLDIQYPEHVSLFHHGHTAGHHAHSHH